MEFQNRNLKVIVGNAITDAAETTLATFKASGSTGEVIATDSKGSVVVAGTTNFIIASKLADGTLDTTEIMNLAHVKTVSAKKYAAAAHKSEVIGYNGTSGEIEVINDNLYQVNIEFLNYGSLSPENRYLRQAHYQSPATGTTEMGVVDGLALSLARNFSREQVQRVKIFRYCSNAGTALATGADNFTFTKGSKYFSATDIDNAVTNAALVVGDYLRIGTAVTSTVYRITAINATTNIGTLDIPFQDATVTIADTGLERIPAADQATAAFGLGITGVDQPFVVGKLRFEPVDWRPITLVDCGATPTTVLTVATNGTGDGRRVSELEWFAQGNFGEVYRMGEPNLYDVDLTALKTGTYDVLVIDYYTEQIGGSNLVASQSPRSVMVFTQTNASFTNMNGLLTDRNKSDLFNITALS